MDNLMLRRRVLLGLLKEEYIIFADPVVEQICATNWGDGVGITPSQAARVTSIANSVFSNNENITSFKELLYFTGITTIDRDMFRNSGNITVLGVPRNVTNAEARGGQFRSIYTEDLDAFLRIGNRYSAPLCNTGTTGTAHLYLNDVEVTAVTFPTGMTAIGGHILYCFGSITSVVIPSGVISIGTSAFYATGLTSLSLPEGITTIGNRAFSRISSLMGVITLPSTLTSIGSEAFRYSPNITAFKCLATTPPTLGQWRDIGHTTYVPYSADHSILAAYQATPGWSSGTTRELDENGNIPS